MSQLFNLKWNNHMNNAIDAFKNLLSTEEMVDVTLVCEGHYVKAHKIILSACSPFFHSLFLEIPYKHPIVILKDVKYTNLKAIIEFVYHGEVNVAQDNLFLFKETAEILQIKGLADSTNESVSASNQDQSSQRTVHKQRKKVRLRHGSLGDQSIEIISEPKIKPPHFFETEALTRDMQPQKSQDSHAESSTPIQPRSSPNIFFFHNQYQQQEQNQILGQGVKQNFPVKVNFSIISQQSLEKQSLEKQSNEVNLPMRSDMFWIQSNISSTKIQDFSSNSRDHPARFVPTSVPSNTSADPTERLLSPCVKSESLELLSSESLAEPSHERDRRTVLYFAQSRMLHLTRSSSCQDNSTRVSTLCKAQDIHTVVSGGNAKTSSSSKCKKSNVKDFKWKCCPHCSYSTMYSTNLEQHIRKHTAKLPYPCLFCTKKRKNKRGLVRHGRTHTGEKPYECSDVS